MNYEIITTKTFKRDFKTLFKKYHSLPDDLGNNTRKIRMAISSKHKGKSGGARVITFDVIVDFNNTDIFLITIYDKGEQATITRKEIEQLKQENGLIY